VSGGAPIRVLIVDDHAVVRDGIRSVLVSEPGFAVVAEADGAEAAVAIALRDGPDVVLLDITMPGGSGLDAVRLLLAASPGSRILLLSVHDRAEYVVRGVRSGAHGYLRKDTSPAELRAAVRAVHGGGEYFSPVVAGRLGAALRGDAPEGAAGAGPARDRSVTVLTARERGVLACVARGLLNKQIAGELGISVRTVEAHRENITRKLGVRSAAGLTRLAIEAGLVPPTDEPPPRT
jgi:DNA-binding NarL/FixJ family response regulator